MVEDQIGEMLGGFAVPGGEREGRLAAWQHYQGRDTSALAVRARLERRLDRLKELCLDGNKERAKYQAERKAITEKLVTLPIDAESSDDAGERLAAFLADVTSAWRVAKPAERNKLARQLFAKVVIHNRTAVAVVPRPDFRPFFFALPVLEGVNPDEKVCTGGSDGDRLREIDIVKQPLVPFLYSDRALQTWERTKQRRYDVGSRRSKIPLECWKEIAERAQVIGLRETARALGVSHETVRRIVKGIQEADAI